MRIAFYGSSLVSAYWNGAATYYQGIIRALAALGYEVTFYEPDVYDRQQHRDQSEQGGSERRPHRLPPAGDHPTGHARSSRPGSPIVAVTRCQIRPQAMIPSRRKRAMMSSVRTRSADESAIRSAIDSVPST